MTGAESNNAVIVRRLCKTYGGMKAIDKVSFRIAKGEVLGFLGPNGAGKSTTMKILAGLIPASSGSAYICGISVANNPQLARSHIGFMPENNPLPEDFRVVEYLTFRAKIKGVSSKDIKARVNQCMEVCQLHRKAANKVIGNLSKGYRQRVGIADALLSNPDVIIMDEPTIGLDPHQILAIRELINSLRGKMSVIISSHILPEIELVCDRVIIINQGSIVASGSPKSLRREFMPFNTYKISLKADEETFKSILQNIGENFEYESASAKDSNGFVDYTIKNNSVENFGGKIVEEFSRNPEFCLREVTLKTPTLEDIFLAATRKSWTKIHDQGESINV